MDTDCLPIFGFRDSVDQYIGIGRDLLKRKMYPKINFYMKVRLFSLMNQVDSAPHDTPQPPRSPP